MTNLATETNGNPGWHLSPARLATLMRGHRIPLSTASPLPSPGSGIEGDTSENDALIAAINQVAQPRLVLGLQLSPAQGEDVLWFYRGLGSASSGFTSLIPDVDGSHYLIPIDETEIQNLIRECLTLEEQHDEVPIDLRVTLSGYVALLGMLDADREHELTSLMKRTPESTPSFAARDIFDVVANGMLTSDMRWITGLGSALSPSRLPLSEKSIETGLSEMAAHEIVEQDGDEWKLRSPGLALAATLGLPLHWSVLHTRRFSGDQESTEHLALVRGAGSLWALDFDDRGVRIQGASSEDIDLMIGTRFLAWRNPSETLPDASGPRRGGVGAWSKRTCPDCGARLREGAAFCPGCGRSTLFCTACSAPLRAASGFCPACGIEVRVAVGERSR